MEVLDRIKVWQDTKQCCLEGKLRNVEVIPSIKLRSADPYMPPRFSDTPVYVLQMDTADAAIDLVRKGYRPLLLNMSDYHKPGGAVEQGSMAQEETLFRRSNYFLTLTHEFYPMATEGTEVVFSPAVCFFKDNEESLYQDYPSGVLVDCIAACIRINQVQVQDDNDDGEQTNLAAATLPVLKEKVRMIFKTGYMYGHDILVLSAPAADHKSGQIIAPIYRELVDEYHGCFAAIVFAIPAELKQLFTETFQDMLLPLMK